MSIPTATLAIAGASAAAAYLVRHEHDPAHPVDRLAAAALETLLNAIDANDAVTGSHVRRVACFSLILADAADLDAEDTRLVEQVALFHDIGKIHEALFDVVHHDAKPTPEERKAILTHPARGADVLAPLSGFYPDLPDGVLSHHEWWNGQGYPRKLKGRRIPLAARIVAIADTFDAITFTRRYHRGESPEAARDIILEGRGTQFDPELVDLFGFPPVFDRIRVVEREVSQWHSPLKKRVQGVETEHVPEITFRWRPEARKTRGSARDRGRAPA